MFTAAEAWVTSVEHAVMVFVSSVTAPPRAKALPTKLAPLFIVMLVNAKMFPAIELFAPIVAELPTCHHTLQAEAPLVSVIDAPLAVVSALPTWNV